MSRNLSTLAKQAVFAQETAEVFLVLVTITHTALATPIRVVANTQDITSRGNLFKAVPFGFIMPGDREDQVPRARLWVDNIDRKIVEAVRTASGSAPQVLAEVVLASQPDTLEMVFEGFSLRDALWDVLTVEGDLSLEDPLNEPAIADRFTPNFFPGLF